jgi:hypothetical protein
MAKFNYTVDGEKQETDKHELTATEIMKQSQVDPNKNYLVLVEGEHKKSYKDNPDEPIHMHENMVFITIALKEGHTLSGNYL